MRIVFVHAGGIGDFLLACPALAAWRPPGELRLLGIRERLEVAVAAGLADAAHDLDAADFASLFTGPSRKCRDFFAETDEAVVWMRDDDGAIARGLARCGVGRVRCFPGLPDTDWARHASAYYAACLGVECAPDFRLALPRIAETFDVLIHPGSGSPKKNWPLEHWHALTRRLQARGREVQWMLGPAEDGLPIPPGVRALPPRSLTETGQCLQNAALYLGNDSGITHLAGLLGTPTIALFGPTNPALWHPLGANTRVLQGNPWPSVEVVAGAVGG